MLSQFNIQARFLFVLQTFFCGLYSAFVYFRIRVDFPCFDILAHLSRKFALIRVAFTSTSLTNERLRQFAIQNHGRADHRSKRSEGFFYPSTTLNHSLQLKDTCWDFSLFNNFKKYFFFIRFFKRNFQCKTYLISRFFAYAFDRQVMWFCEFGEIQMLNQIRKLHYQQCLKKATLNFDANFFVSIVIRVFRKWEK